MKDISSILLSLSKQQPKLTNSNSSSSDCTQQTRGITQLLKIALLSNGRKSHVCASGFWFILINNVDLPPDSVDKTARNVILHEIRVTSNLLYWGNHWLWGNWCSKSLVTPRTRQHTWMCSRAASACPDPINQLSNKGLFTYNHHSMPASTLKSPNSPQNTHRPKAEYDALHNPTINMCCAPLTSELHYCFYF